MKTVGELIQNKLRVGLRRMERVIKERMSIRDQGGALSPVSLVNIRPLVASLREFFGSSQLSQFMEETNPLRRSVRVVCAVNALALMCGMCTSLTTAVSARLKPPKARISA